MRHPSRAWRTPGEVQRSRDDHRLAAIMAAATASIGRAMTSHARSGCECRGFGLQRLRPRRAIARRRREDHLGRDGRDRVEDPAPVLVLHDADDERDALRIRLLHVRRERARARRVVRAVDQHLAAAPRRPARAAPASRRPRARRGSRRPAPARGRAPTALRGGAAPSPRCPPGGGPEPEPHVAVAPCAAS